MSSVFGEFDAAWARPVVTANEVEEGDTCWLAARSDVAVLTTNAGDGVKGGCVV